MPVDSHVYVVEQAGTHHVYFTGATFFSRTTIHFDGSGQFFFFNEFFDRDTCCNGSCTKEVVTAAMASSLACNAFFLRNGLLSQSGQRIKFCQDADDRLTASVGSHKSRGDICHTGFHCEAFLA